MFKFLYGEEGAPINEPAASADGEVIEFDQAEFFAGSPWVDSMAKFGYLYVPTGCKSLENRCKLHIAFHGCGMLT